MKFLIKNYNKDADNNREILATVLFEVETIKEAQEKMAEFITKIKDNWRADFSKDNKKFTATAMIVNLYHILDGMDIENYRNGNHEEFLSKFDFHTRNVLNPTDKPIVAFLSDLMLKQENELYIRLNKKKNRIDALDEKSNFSSSWKFEKPKGKHDIEYQMKYLADQLEDGKIYKISDIITDKAYKKLENNEEK